MRTVNQCGSQKTGCIRDEVGLEHVNVQTAGWEVFVRVRKKWYVSVYVRGYVRTPG